MSTTEESDKSTLAAPPPPVQVAQLTKRQKQMRGRTAGRLTSTRSWSWIAGESWGRRRRRPLVRRRRRYTHGLC
jgi:hypothetical protein